MIMIKKLVRAVGIITLFACTLPIAAQDIKDAKDTKDSQVRVRYSDLIKEYQKDMSWQKIWGKHTRYMNIGYVNQSLTRKEYGGGTWRSYFGFHYGFGRTYYLHKKPIAGMIKFGIDWTYCDLNLAKYEDTFGFFNGDAEDMGYGDYYYEEGHLPSSPELNGSVEMKKMQQYEFSTQIGPSVTINPVSYLKAGLYFRVAPSYSLLTVQDSHGSDLLHSYGTFFTLGGSVSYKAISIGIEGRWGNTKYNNIDLGNLEEEESWNENTSMGDMLRGENDKTKWKTGSMRFYISFRY